MWWNRYLAVPFLEKGRSMEGCDCWGLVREIYRQERGIHLPDYLECYESTNDRDKLGAVIAAERAAKWETHDGAPLPFDVLILRMRGVPMHVGVVTKPGHMLHCSRGVGTAHEPFNNLKWKNLVMGFARWES